MTTPRIEAKLKREIAKENVKPEATPDILFRASEFAENAAGKIRHTETGLSVRRWLEQQRTTKPHMFAGPAVRSDSNPWKLGDQAGAQEQRIAIIRKSSRIARDLAAAAGTDLAGRKLRERT